VPVVTVPTTYNSITEAELIAEGSSIIIYANHLLRAAYPAMLGVAESILVNATALQEFCLRIPRPALRSILRISRHMRTQYQNRQNALRAICQMRIARNTQSSP
jgi:hypothetical protein